MGLAEYVRLRPWAQDVLLAAFVTVMQVIGTRQTASNAEPGLVERTLADVGYLGYSLLIVGGLSLVVRRRHPVAVFVVNGVISLVYFAAGFPDGPAWIALFVALYTVTAYGDGRRSLLLSGAGIAVFAAGWLVEAADVEPRVAIGWVFFRIGLCVVAAALGESVRSRRVIVADAQERAERAERTREEEVRRRVDAERLRIAREVHDTVAHAVAIINVQAGVTAHVLDKRPERARETLVTIEQTSAQALREMRAILGVLRSADDHEGAPGPSLAQLDEIVTMARDAGLDVELAVGSPAQELPSAVDRAAYRILQESITNTVRHAGPTRVRVSLRYGPTDLDIRVTDDGRGRGDDRDRGDDRGRGDDLAAERAGSGRGIVGMRERCELLGGDLAAGARPDGGFEVRARLPLQPVGVVPA
ncbi:signal transduction histidine kinase [Haloactinopolyspora alba]|uniref:histidine kinase n=1 Tax=Haloactinopolyspora alba TaxID=648780 RepID=A0A2P8E8Q8_9ACTN|nr:histidine kinase [Haloactinopolyspora alba]PSL05880.1 signal transduction histidine kinase [Haloactinopolyspora alba]